MRNFIFMIGRDDEFEDESALVSAWLKSPENLPYGASWYSVSLPTGDETVIAVRINNYEYLPYLAQVIMMGEAMFDSWCLDDVVTVLLEEVDGKYQQWLGKDDWTPVGE